MAPLPVSGEWLVKIGDDRFEVVLGDGHAMVDGVRVDGTCDWRPGMVQATATGKGRWRGSALRSDRRADRQ